MYLLICALVITIVWVTTFYNNITHLSLAAVIFITVVVVIILNSYLIEVIFYK